MKLLNSIIFIINIILIIVVYCLYYNQREYFSNPFLNKKQKIFKRTLEDIADILNKNNIEFTLSSGTALGAYREHKFIEHDHDIDLGIDTKMSDRNNLQNLQNLNSTNDLDNQEQEQEQEQQDQHQ